jgi:hypothetical protein
MVIANPSMRVKSLEASHLHFDGIKRCHKYTTMVAAVHNDASARKNILT